MPSFIGDILCKIESKGRLLFPAGLKKQLENEQNTFIIKKDIYEKCLVLYTIDEWQKQIDSIRKKLNSYNKEHSRFLREFYRDTAELTLDASNRLVIPKRLAELVEIQNEVYLIGIDTKIEIWAKEIYEKLEFNQDNFALLTEKILGGQNIDE